MSSFSARWLQQRRRIGGGWHNWKEPLGSSSETGNDNNLEYLCACSGSRSTATTRIRRGVRKQLQCGVLVRGTTCKESSTNFVRKAGSKKNREEKKRREKKENTVHTPVTLKHFISIAMKESAAADALLALWPHLLLVCNSIRNGGRSVGGWVGCDRPTDKGPLILDRLAPNVKWRSAAPCSAFSSVFFSTWLQRGFILFLLFFLLGRVYVCVCVCVCKVRTSCVCIVSVLQGQFSSGSTTPRECRVHWPFRLLLLLLRRALVSWVCLRAVCVCDVCLSIRRPIPSLPQVLKRNTNSASVRRKQDKKRRDGQAQPTPAVRQLDSSEATAGK